MRFKKLNGRYLNSLYSLGKQEFKGEFWFTKGFLRDTAKRHGIYLGAFEKNKLVGAIYVDLLDKPKAWIFFFDVEKSHRKKGIGSSLLEKAEKNLPKGYEKLFVDFEKKDKEAKKFYKEHGFKLAGKIKDWFGLSTEGLIYSKTIRKNNYLQV